MTDDVSDLEVALKPLLDVIGADFVPADAIEPGDIPIALEGATAFGVRVFSLEGALDRMVQQIETEFGATLPDLDRVDKQRAIRLLDERGAFLLRRAIEDVADLMGVSRITIYNYLNTIRD